MLHLGGLVKSKVHGDNIEKRLHEMFITEEYSDVTLVTETSTFKAHKVILAANSDYFNAMFSSTCSETLNSVVSFKENPDVSSTGLSAILHYAYLGTFQVTDISVCDILAAARHFLISDVTHLCELYLLDSRLTKDNVTNLLETAMNFELDNVMLAWEKFILIRPITAENYVVTLQVALVRGHKSILNKVIDFINRRQFDLLNCQELLLKLVNTPTKFIDLLKSDTHGLQTNMILMEFIVKWVQTDVKERLPALADIIAAVNLLYFDDESLDAIADMPLLREDEKCRDMISEAQRFLCAIQTDETEQDDAFVVTVDGGCLKLNSVVNEYMINGDCELPILGQYEHGWMEALTCIVSLGNTISLMYSRGTMLSYEPRRNVWKRLADSTRYQGELGAAFFDDEVYVICGTNKSKETLRIYSMKEDLWRNGPSLPLWTCGNIVVAPDAGLYVLGFDLKSSGRLFMRYNPQECVWERKAHPLCPGHILFPGTDCLYLLNVKPDHLIVNRYDPNTDQWTAMNTQHSFKNLTLRDGSLHMGVMYVVGEDRFTRNEMSTLFKFDGDSGQLEKVKDMPSIYFAPGSQLNIVNIPKRSIAKFFEPVKQQKRSAFHAHYN